MLQCLIISQYCEIAKLLFAASRTLFTEKRLFEPVAFFPCVVPACCWIFHCQLPRTFGNTPSQMQPNFAWCLYISGNGRCTCGFWTAKQTLSHIDLTVQIIQIERQRDCWARQCDSNWNLVQCTSASVSIEIWHWGIHVCHMIPNLNAFQVVGVYYIID